MKPRRCAKNLLVGLVATLLLSTGGGVGVARAAQTSPALTADHVIACIRTAVAAQAGAIEKVEVKYRRGQWLCEVELVDEAGQEYELRIDVATYQVVKTERD
jgi:ABC-type tungstate transport system substrate-binding protein